MISRYWALPSEREAVEVGRKRDEEALSGSDCAAASRDDFGIEEPKAASGALEAQAVAVERVVDVSSSHARRTRPRSAPDLARSVGEAPVQPREEERAKAGGGSRAQKRRTLSSRKMS